MAIERPDWGNGGDAGQQQTQAEKPPLSAADLSMLAPDDTAAEAAPQSEPGSQAADEFASAREMLRLGFSADEVKRLCALSPDELEEIQRPPPKKPSTASVSAELREIDRLRRANPKRYFADEKLQRRERKLLEQREAIQAKLQDAAEDDESEGGEADLSELPDGLAEEWAKSGGVKHHLETAQKAALAVLDDLGEDDRSEFQAGFDSLPVSIQAEAFRHLATGETGYTKTASAAELEAFKETDEGAELVAEWRGRAGQRLGRLQQRMKSVLDGMSDADRQKAVSWFDGLPAPAAKAVMRMLAK